MFSQPLRRSQIADSSNLPAYSVATSITRYKLLADETDSGVGTDNKLQTQDRNRHRSPKPASFCQDNDTDSRDGPIVLATVFDHQVKVFLDTGARINIIKPATLKEIARRHSVGISRSAIPDLSGISGGRITVLGDVYLTLRIGNKPFSLTCLVVDHINFPGDILLGLDSMIQFNIVLFPQKWSITLDSLVVPLCAMYRSGREFLQHLDYAHFVSNQLVSLGLNSSSAGSTPEHSGSESSQGISSESTQESGYRDYLQGDAQTDARYLARLVASITQVKGSLPEDTVLYSHALTRTKVRLPGVPDSAHVIVDSDTCRVNGTYVEPSLHVVQNGIITVYFANTSGADINLKSGTHVVDFAHYSLPVRVIDEISSEQAVYALSSGGSESQPEVKVEHLGSTDFPSALSQLLDILNKYRGVVALSGEKLGLTPLITHRIPLEPGT